MTFAFKHIRTRMIVVFLALLGGVLAAALYAVYASSLDNARARAEAGFRLAGGGFEQHVARRGASLANIFFQIPALALTLSAVAILLFSGFLLYDVSRVVNGGETNYVMATLAIYLDIYNIFVNLLQLLMAFMGERD